MVITLAAQAAITPAGKPTGAPIPVAPVVAIVMLGDIAVFTQTVGLEEGNPAVLLAETAMVPVVAPALQPPIKVKV